MFCLYYPCLARLRVTVTCRMGKGMGSKNWLMKTWCRNVVLSIHCEPSKGLKFEPLNHRKQTWGLKFDTLGGSRPCEISSPFRRSAEISQGWLRVPQRHSRLRYRWEQLDSSATCQTGNPHFPHPIEVPWMAMKHHDLSSCYEEVASLKLTASSHLKMVVSNRNLLFQRSIFRCYVSFREGISR